MPDAAYRDAIVDYIRREAQPADKFGHQPRLYALTAQIGAGENYDDDVVFAAAWLHDIGVFVGHRPEEPSLLAKWDNVAYACRETPGLLHRFGFPVEKIPAVVEAIRTHLPAAQPTSMEGTILRDADILEQLGAIAVARTVAKVGRDTRYSSFSSVVPVLRRALIELPDQIRLPRAKEMAESKITALQEFLDSLDDEAMGELH